MLTIYKEADFVMKKVRAFFKLNLNKYRFLVHLTLTSCSSGNLAVSNNACLQKIKIRNKNTKQLSL